MDENTESYFGNTSPCNSMLNSMQGSIIVDPQKEL